MTWAISHFSTHYKTLPDCVGKNVMLVRRTTHNKDTSKAPPSFWYTTQTQNCLLWLLFGRCFWHPSSSYADVSDNRCGCRKRKIINSSSCSLKFIGQSSKRLSWAGAGFQWCCRGSYFGKRRGLSVCITSKRQTKEVSLFHYRRTQRISFCRLFLWLASSLIISVWKALMKTNCRPTLIPSRSLFKEFLFSIPRLLMKLILILETSLLCSRHTVVPAV